MKNGRKADDGRDRAGGAKVLLATFHLEQGGWDDSCVVEVANTSTSRLWPAF